MNNNDGFGVFLRMVALDCLWWLLIVEKSTVDSAK